MNDALLLEQLTNRNNPKAIAAQLRAATRRAAALTFLRKWYDEYFFCPDPLGHGNLEWPIREQYLRLLGQVFRHAVEARQRMDTPFQLLLSINLANSAYDSIDIHTPNPCSANFPIEYPQELKRESGEVALFLSELTGIAGLKAGCTQNCLCVFSPSHGLPFPLSGAEPLDGAVLLKRLKRPPFSPQAIAAGLRRAEKTVETARLELGQESWFDGSHFHLDWKGHSNLTWKIRERYMLLMGQLYLRLASQLKRWSKRYQLFIGLDVLHAEHDAVFLHSPNLNADNFPFMIQDLEWDVPRVRSLLAEQVPIPNLRAGFDRKTRWLCLYSPEVGVPLQS